MLRETWMEARYHGAGRQAAALVGALVLALGSLVACQPESGPPGEQNQPPVTPDTGGWTPYKIIGEITVRSTFCDPSEPLGACKVTIKSIDPPRVVTVDVPAWAWSQCSPGRLWPECVRDR